jgi:2-iminobutanoate/2-iminopropanoate deaminase
MDGDLMSNSIKNITTETAPQPFWHYAQATEAAGVVYVSGQLAARADGASLADQPFEVQARQALANIIAIVGEQVSAVIASQK